MSKEKILYYPQYSSSENFALLWVELLDNFFSDNRGYEICLYGWQQSLTKKHNLSTSKVIFYIKWIVEDQGEFVYSGSGDHLFKEKNFKKPFMGCKNNLLLTSKIHDYLVHQDFVNKENDPDINMFTGICFYPKTWKEQITKIFNENIYKQYMSEQMRIELTKKLNKKIPVNNKIAAKSKI